MAKYSINLLQAGLLPAKALWTLNRVVGLWLVTLLIMLALMLIANMQVTSLTAQYQAVDSVKNTQELQLKDLESTISGNRKDAALLEKLKTVKLLIANKQSLHLQLTDPTQTYGAGFSSAMTELASLHNQNISLQRVTLGNGNMTFSGIARTPDAVPSWLSGFEASTFLSGEGFINFSLTENKDKITEFVVSSAAKKGE
ncbi:hypothetical protein EKO29_18310 [Colwellia sp. Arc7-635]|jgi:hypothetical protein|uniref:PilN domain-containing protein n=1 Tax=Colwellia sp. Arc7-635 TaxID=2497879 RepID=UPI000F85221F|nr:PilN domain-containing protein [Colwellia sp. Arc7-635]AZQ85776.1 hypothetical protein EKO29_18310 [Colwellia sp. Arc7-635]